MNEPIQLPHLPIGLTGFEVLRKSGNLYVDKTALIYDLITSSNRFIALSAPRRFGKSLTLSTIASVFEHGMQFCEGLAIEKLWTDKTYPTVSLDFSGFENINTLDHFQRKFRKRLKSIFDEYGFKASDDLDDFHEDFRCWLHSLPKDSLVVLIDEYDRPLTQFVDTTEIFKAVQAELCTFFSTLKSKNDRLRFLFITGVTRYSHTGIYSGPNFIEDISLEPEYASLLGYTQSEVEHYFSGYIEQTALHLNMTKGELLTQMKDYYDGFCLDLSTQVHVYDPWSILMFFKKKRFGNFWFQSAGNYNLLLSRLFAAKINKPEDFYRPISMSPDILTASVDYSKLDPNVILFDTGYLTISKVLPSGDLELKHPNQKVSESLNMLFISIMTNSAFDDINRPLLNYLLDDDMEEAVKYFNSAFASIDYNRYPVKDEASFQALLQMLMKGNGLHPKIEQHQAGGRTDIELSYGNFYYVFELKYAGPRTSPQKRLDEAIKQIKKNRYGAHVYGKTLERVALVFSDKTKSVYYQEVSGDLDASTN